jgi:ABC-type transport system involved in cytochrome c biogenesis permease subunit
VIAKHKSRINREILGCAFLILATIGIACSGSREPAQRLLSYELALTLAAIICLATNFVFSILYLAYRQAHADALALSAAQVGVIFLSVLLVGGPLWFHHLFAVWWPRDKVLTWGILIWPVYLSCLLLRRSASVGQGSTLGAVLSVFAFLDLPLAYFSVVLRQQRSSSVARLSAVLPSVVCICASLTALAAVAIWLLYQRERNQQEVEAQEALMAR